MMLRKMRDLLGNRSGNVAIIFGFGAVLFCGMAALAVDYGTVLTTRTRLSAASDQAALAAIEKAEADTTNNLPTAAALADGQAAGLAAFQGNAGTAYSSITQTPTISVTRTGLTFTATVSYNASSNVVFGPFVNTSTAAMSGSSTASLTMGSYISFYVMLDVSGSMGVPSTTAGQSALAAINPDMSDVYPGGCIFACHQTTVPNCTMTSSYAAKNTANKDAKTGLYWCQGYNLSRTAGTNATPVAYCPQPNLPNCIQLKVDAVAYAMQQMASTAQSTELYPNQYSIGLFPFIVNPIVLQPVTTNLASVASIASTIPALLDTGNGSGNGGSGIGSGGTHMDNALDGLAQYITFGGDGTLPSNPKPFVFLITDGAQDPQLGNQGKFTGVPHATPINPNWCTQITGQGATLAILYIPYPPIENPTTYSQSEDIYVNNAIPYIPAALQSCASPGFFFTADTPADINSAMQAMFQQSVLQARLTQ